MLPFLLGLLVVNALIARLISGYIDRSVKALVEDVSKIDETRKLPGLLRQTLSSTNAMESANSGWMGIIRRVFNFKDGAMTLRYAAATIGTGSRNPSEAKNESTPR